MKRPVSWIVALGVLTLLGWSCLFQVNENEAVIVARFGDPSRVVEDAGLSFKYPPPIDTLIRVDRRTHILDPETVEYLTEDKKNVLVSCFVAWSVAEPIDFIRSARDLATAEARLADIALAELGSILGAHPLEALVSTAERETSMEDLDRELTDSIAERAQTDFGIKVHCARIKRLTYPRQNKEAVFNRMEAERKKIAQEIRAEGLESAERIRADAKKEAALLINEARRRAEELGGEGEAEATRIYGEAYGSDPEFYEFLRTLEVYERVFGEKTTIVIPASSELLEFLRTAPKIERSAGSGGSERKSDG